MFSSDLWPASGSARGSGPRKHLQMFMWWLTLRWCFLLQEAEIAVGGRCCRCAPELRCGPVRVTRSLTSPVYLVTTTPHYGESWPFVFLSQLPPSNSFYLNSCLNIADWCIHMRNLCYFSLFPGSEIHWFHKNDGCCLELFLIGC